MAAYSLCFFNVKTLAGSTYRFSFGVDKFEWDKFDDVFKLVSGLIEMLWSSVLFCIALRCSSNLSLKAHLVCPMYSAGVFGLLLHLRHWTMKMRFLDGCDRLLDQ